MRQMTRRVYQRGERVSPRRRRGQSGQTLVIFALSVFVLIGLAGLAVDVLRAYDLYAHEQRAAEAGALAGVIYMPNFYNQQATTIDNNSAISRALQEVQKNGFGTALTTGAMPTDCNTADTSAEVTVCKDPAASGTALQVTVTEPIDVFLLAVVGVQSFSVSA